MYEKPSLYGFLRAIFARWFTAMSGQLSVPAAIAAFFVPNDIAKLLLALTAIACFVFTAYCIWAAERQKVVDLQEKMNEKSRRDELTTILQQIFTKTLQLHGEQQITDEKHQPWK